jgi:hypothetical protein
VRAPPAVLGRRHSNHAPNGRQDHGPMHSSIMTDTIAAAGEARPFPGFAAAPRQNRPLVGYGLRKTPPPVSSEPSPSRSSSTSTASSLSLAVHGSPPRGCARRITGLGCRAGPSRLVGCAATASVSATQSTRGRACAGPGKEMRLAAGAFRRRLLPAAVVAGGLTGEKPAGRFCQ